MSRAKYTVEMKLRMIKAYLAGEGSYKTIAKKYGVGHRSVEVWVRTFREQGNAVNLRGAKLTEGFPRRFFPPLKQGSRIQ